MYRPTYPRPLHEKEFQAIVKVQRSGKSVDFKRIHTEMLKNKSAGHLYKPVFEAIYRHYF